MSVSQQENCAQVPRAERIARLNDNLRRSGKGGQVVLTSGVQELTGADVPSLLKLLAEYDSFDADNDPHGERDSGDLDFKGSELLWKIDYYDRELTYASADPADDAVTVRVLTVMLAEEY